MNAFKFYKITSNDEINISFKIRKKVFCGEQNISEDIEFDNLDHLCNHFMIYKKREAIATARVREKENHIFKIERVAVLVEHRNIKVGSLLINEIIKYYNENNIHVKKIVFCIIGPAFLIPVSASSIYFSHFEKQI